MTREEAARMCEAVVRPTFGTISSNDNNDAYKEAFEMAIAALREVDAMTQEYITGGCEYCKAGKGIMNHYGIDFYAFAMIENGQFEMAYSNNIRGDGLVAGHKAVKINYCPMCGRKLGVEE